MLRYLVIMLAFLSGTFASTRVIRADEPAQADSSSELKTKRQYVISCKISEKLDGQEERVISSPTLITLPRREAQVQIGGEVPVPGTSQTERVRVGVSARFLVIPIDDNQARLDLTLQVSEAEQSDLEDLLVVGRTLRSVSSVPLGGKREIVFERNADGEKRRWLEIQLSQKIVQEPNYKRDVGSITRPIGDMHDLYTVVYDVADLAPLRFEPNGIGPKSADLSKLLTRIQSEVKPATWKTAGGDGAIVTHQSTASLIVRQSKEVHDSLKSYLNQMRD